MMMMKFSKKKMEIKLVDVLSEVSRAPPTMHVITCCRSSVFFFMEMLSQLCYCSPSDGV
jgi:hypothetical protein